MLGGMIRRLRCALVTPRFTRSGDRSLFTWMNEHGEGKRILNLGSGFGNFDDQLSPTIRMVNMDIAADKPGLAIQADAHELPFGDGTFDIVYSIAVLEHVRKPWIVADEIWRVLRPGGHVAVELPFLNVIHSAEDYFRFTDKGLRSLFDEPRFIPVKEQMGSEGGSFLGPFLLMYLAKFLPGRWMKLVWRVVMSYPLSWLKYLDVIPHSRRVGRLTANSFGLIAEKQPAHIASTQAQPQSREGRDRLIVCGSEPNGERRASYR